MTNKKENLYYSVKIDQTTIKQSKCIKYIEVLHDDSFWKPEIQRVSSKLAGGFWALYHLRKHVNCKTLLLVYNGIIYRGGVEDTSFEAKDSKKIWGQG